MFFGVFLAENMHSELHNLIYKLKEIQRRLFENIQRVTSDVL